MFPADKQAHFIVQRGDLRPSPLWSVAFIGWTDGRAGAGSGARGDGCSRGWVLARVGRMVGRSAQMCPQKRSGQDPAKAQ